MIRRLLASGATPERRMIPFSWGMWLLGWAFAASAIWICTAAILEWVE